MQTRTSRGFTLVELLVVIAIIAVLIALMVPAAQAVRRTMRTANCQSNLHNIGEAAHQFIAASSGKNGINPNGWRTQFLPYLQGQDSVMSCPELESSAIGYGMNDVGGKLRLGQSDSRRILMLDYDASFVDVGASTVTDSIRATKWDTLKAPRHSGMINVLYMDAHVDSRDDTEIDPVVLAIRENLWLPYIANKWDIKVDPMEGWTLGLWAEYRKGIDNYSGSPVIIRTDPDLKLPFGDRNDNNKNDPLSYSSGENHLMSVHYVGQIKADKTGTYTFYVKHDDGTTITVNGQTVFSRTGHVWSVTAWVSSQPIQMVEGQWVDFDLKVSNWDGPYSLEVQWASDSGVSQQSIPNANVRSKPTTGQ